MALTRKMLSAMDIEPEKIDEIISAHAESINALKEDKANLEAKLEELKTAKADLDKANEDLKGFKEGDWEKKYTDLKAEFDTFKTDIKNKADKQAKEAAYKKLLVDAGISEKRVGSIMKVTDLSGISVDEKGAIKDADKLTESVKTEWADFIVTKEERGSFTPTPPASDGSVPTGESRAAQLAKQYRENHYGKED